MNEAIVLRKIDFEETSLILNVLTRDGYESLMVKGAKRKNSEKLAISETISLIEFEKSRSKKFPSLTEGIVKDSFFEIKNDLIKLSIASVVCDYVLMIEGTELDTKKLYDLTLMTLDEIKLSNDPEESLFRFEIVLSGMLGVGMNKEHIMEAYSPNKELLEDIDNLLKGEKTINRVILRNFMKEYYKDELGLNLRSKKLYFDLMGE